MFSHLRAYYNISVSCKYISPSVLLTLSHQQRHRALGKLVHQQYCTQNQPPANTTHLIPSTTHNTPPLKIKTLLQSPQQESHSCQKPQNTSEYKFALQVQNPKLSLCALNERAAGGSAVFTMSRSGSGGQMCWSPSSSCYYRAYAVVSTDLINCAQRDKVTARLVTPARQHTSDMSQRAPGRGKEPCHLLSITTAVLPAVQINDVTAFQQCHGSKAQDSPWGKKIKVKCYYWC